MNNDAAPWNGLRVRLEKNFPALRIEVAFTLMSSWTVLFGPSGSGKTTVLRMIAGLDRPDVGQVIVHSSASGHEETLFDSTRRVNVATHRRAVHMVTQRPALFPHMTVEQNVLYRHPVPARFRESGKAGLEEHLASFRIDHLRSRMPGSLSGGERQRVALAQTLLPSRECRLLLLDEPFAGLDSLLRDDLIAELRRLVEQRRTPVLLVTHDVGEAWALQAPVLKISSGKITHQGRADEVLGSERQRLLEKLGSR